MVGSKSGMEGTEEEKVNMIGVRNKKRHEMKIIHGIQKLLVIARADAKVQLYQNQRIIPSDN